MTLVPFYDLSFQHRELGEELSASFLTTLYGNSFIGGRPVADFEDAFARYTGVPYCVTVGNGTDAIELALRALGIRQGHEVVLPANTFIATATAVLRAGATPVLVDVDEETGLLLEERVADAINRRTAAIIPVHLYGQQSPVEKLIDLVRDTDIRILEDAAQAHGARRNGLHPGTLSSAAIFSFYPSKNLGALGDGGAVLTVDRETAEEVRRLGNYGASSKYVHDSVGFNSRLDAVQAAFLLRKLTMLERWNDMRRSLATRYIDLLGQQPRIGLPRILDGNCPAWHLFVVQVPERDEVVASLLRNGVETQVHYPLPLHLQEALSELGYRKGCFPRAERRAKRIMSLPLFPGMREQQQDFVIENLLAAIG